MILIKDGRLIDPLSQTDEIRDIVIDGGIIKHIGKFAATDDYDQIIEAKGHVVTPGLLDIHVHFRDPGQTHKEDINTGANAAAKGGFTTVVMMANTTPVIDNEETLNQVLEIAKKVPIHVKTVAAVSKGFKGKELTDMKKLMDMGAVGFSDDGLPLMNVSFVRKAMNAIKDLDTVMSLHEEDPSLIGKAGINDGKVSRVNGFVGAPKVSETVMIARDCMLALDTGAKVHIQHLSCAESVELIRTAKKLGANITCEVTPQHFSLTDQAVLEKGTLAKLNPPLRTERDRYEMILGLKDGTIDMIVTDHAPHSCEEKGLALEEAPSGLTGLETSLAVGITNLVRKGHLSLPELIEKMSLTPARLYGFDAGHLTVGGKADITIFDDREAWEVKPSEFVSKSANSPFIGETLLGKVKYTICNGTVVYSDK